LDKNLPIQGIRFLPRVLTANRTFALRLAVRGRAPVSRQPGPVSGACLVRPRSSWSPPLAPPAPQRTRCPPCSSASRLLWRSVTSHDRASSATAPHLPDTDQSSTPLLGLLVDREISRFPHKKRTHMPGSSTTPGRQSARA